MTDETPSPTVEPTLPPPRRSTLKTVVLSAVLLVSGMVIGSGLTVIGIRHWFTQMRDQPDIFSDRILARMQSDLKLTNPQKTEIKKIFKDAHDELDEVRQRHRAQGHAFFKEVHDKVAQVLTPSQQKDWDEWWKRARERAMRKGPPRPGMKAGGQERERRPRPEAGMRDVPLGPGDAQAPAADVTAPPPNGIPEHHFADDPAAVGPEKQQEIRRAPAPQAP